MALELSESTARTIPAVDLLNNIDEWVDFLIENRNEVTFDETLGFWEMTINFPKFPMVYQFMLIRGSIVSYGIISRVIIMPICWRKLRRS